MPRKPESHPRLKHPPIREVLLEIRFESILDYSVVPGLVFRALRRRYPNPEELPAALFPTAPGMPKMLRNRFSSEDHAHIVQLGIGIATVNTLAYTSYQDFEKDCKTALRALFAANVIGKVNRIGLRYINNEPLKNRDVSSLIRFRIDAPDLVESHARSREFTWTSPHESQGMLRTRVAWPITDSTSNEEGLLLDFDYFTQFDKSMSADEILAWESEAHNHVYDVFVGSLQPDFYHELLGGENDDVI